MTRKEAFNLILKKHGYTSVNNFCIKNQLQQSNLNRRVKDETIQVELPILFNLANLLHEPIETIIKIFYPAEYKENRDNIR